MSIVQHINEDIKKAMLAKEKEKLEALRAIKSALLLLATDAGSKGEVADEEAVKAMQKLVKQRKDAAAIYTGQGRADLAQTEEYQASIIEQYLPAQLGEDAIRQVVQAKIAESGAKGPAAMGQVMGAVMKELGGQADGKTISKVVKEELSR